MVIQFKLNQYFGSLNWSVWNWWVCEVRYSILLVWFTATLLPWNQLETPMRQLWHSAFFFIHFVKYQVPWHRCHVSNLVWIELCIGEIFEATERWGLSRLTGGVRQWCSTGAIVLNCVTRKCDWMKSLTLWIEVWLRHFIPNMILYWWMWK